MKPTPIKSPADNLPRVCRGGGWDYADPSMFRSANRFGISPAYRLDYLGFRCAQRGVRMTLVKATP